MTNFRQEELTEPRSEEMRSEFADAAWIKIRHPTMLRAGKRAVDIAASLFFFTAFGWLYVLLAIGVFLSSGAPVLYSQPRFGRGGRVFKFYKFRSMLPNSAQILEEHLRKDPVARQQWDDYQKLENDPRITRFGKFIRKTSLDELPQFWNVLVGDMSLVGPRPCMLDQKGLYGADWSFYCAVRPGITGLWQVSGRNQLSYKKRVALDVAYVETLSVGRDIGIFIKTIWVVAVGHGSR
ncbi:exopolysaccharide production protein ExoY [Variovorax paradoxus]|uniref:sugar transferase n=1 Tax=Variovorax paradoxus TaxID=34073 RepID=UPI0027940649|nr:sugar transferase [Variovorax paradoxus]MDQ0571968.1 exopolysaccharide production protein ExoY [Variovorax paradoxus]